MNKDISWDTLDIDLKKVLLHHWFHYYGGEIYTLMDLESYENLLDKEYDNIFKSIVATYIAKDTIQSTYLLHAIRSNKTKELFEHLPNVSDIKPEDLEIYNSIELLVLTDIVTTYNNIYTGGEKHEEDYTGQITQLKRKMQ